MWSIKLVKGLFFVILIAICVLSCSPQKLFFLNSDGIVTYNRHTGQFEMLWEAKTAQESAFSGKVIHDTVYVDSCRLKR